jgi:hypothetical protein
MEANGEIPAQFDVYCHTALGQNPSGHSSFLRSLLVVDLSNVTNVLSSFL